MGLGRKKKTSVALDENLLSWIDEMIERKRFANRTHAIEYALQRLKEQEEEELHVPEREFSK
jgi:Arc/MetJ-type ribon-helix-helix transcriptional regulator